MISTSSTLRPPCCETDDASTRPPSARRTPIELLQWLVSATIVLLMPKCPLCLAAYIALGTGFGLSITTATYLRTSLLITAGLSLAYQTFQVIARWRQRSLARLPR